jgi:hypothetical protein
MKTGADQMEKLKKIIGPSKQKHYQQSLVNFHGSGIFQHYLLTAC